MPEKYNITKKEEVYTLLKRKRNFEFMSEPLLRKLIDVMKVVRFREERLLIKQGTESAFFYIIIKGSVSVYVDGKFLYKLRRTGDVFGEISFISQEASTASIKADKDLGVIAISYSFFNKLKNVELALWLARVVAEKLVRTSKLKSSETPAPELSGDLDAVPVIPDLIPDPKAPSTAADNSESEETAVSDESDEQGQEELEAGK